MVFFERPRQMMKRPSVIGLSISTMSMGVALTIVRMAMPRFCWEASSRAVRPLVSSWSTTP